MGSKSAAAAREEEGDATPAPAPEPQWERRAAIELADLPRDSQLLVLEHCSPGALLALMRAGSRPMAELACAEPLWRAHLAAVRGTACTHALC